MGKITGFLEIDKQDRQSLPIAERVRNFKEFVLPLSGDDTRSQAARCMDCGIPFCHQGCPVNNQIPDWNDLVYKGDWHEALTNLHSTNNFPEFTGRICPAPCEAACTLNIENEPVTIKTIECAIIDRGWQEGWVKPQAPLNKNGKKVAIVGSGPAGLACAQQLARQGYLVDVFEKNAKAGGLLRYGIPDFKMEKRHIDRRIAQMEAEGCTFHYNINITELDALLKNYDAVALAAGAETPRDLPIDGRELSGIHFAMDFLPQQNRRLSNEPISAQPISAEGKNVIVIGGGDTGSDCIGTSFRQGAASVTQLEIMPKPPLMENKALVWPDWPMKFRTSSSQEEGAERTFSVMTERFIGENGAVAELECVKVGDDASGGGGGGAMNKIQGSQFRLKAELVLLAMGFVAPIYNGMLENSRLALDKRGNVLASTRDYKTSLDKVFACGDIRRGQSLVVWAIREGRQAARAIDEFIFGKSELPR